MPVTRLVLRLLIRQLVDARQTDAVSKEYDSSDYSAAIREFDRGMSQRLQGILRHMLFRLAINT